MKGVVNVNVILTGVVINCVHFYKIVQRLLRLFYIYIFDH